ncbi:hypothetical protein E4S40_11330 [Algoriphagus kandeliae]|uniref:PorT family protein n=1 Tax=Algoriphagus kandeliae TaxID=2562278 RepID=A0A4Y9QQT1_9BACT|nr:hypothetical protein [Algoriphagus kandeliae]TFV94600.1 hypothetical protein E4S40_11330 [Algoriphagus kandeliae]
MEKVRLGIFALVFLYFLSVPSFGQQGSGLGIKFGTNYNTSGKYFKDLGNVWQDPLGNVGYHAGLFYTMNSYDIYLRPELVYTETRFQTVDGEAFSKRIDVPVLLGIRLFQVLTAFGGPSAHYTLKDNFLPSQVDEFNKRLRLGYQFGLGVAIGPVGLDLRYEREFNDQKINLERILGQDRNFRSQQIILAVSLRIFGP